MCAFEFKEAKEKVVDRRKLIDFPVQKMKTTLTSLF